MRETNRQTEKEREKEREREEEEEREREGERECVIDLFILLTGLEYLALVTHIEHLSALKSFCNRGNSCHLGFPVA